MFVAFGDGFHAVSVRRVALARARLPYALLFVAFGEKRSIESKRLANPSSLDSQFRNKYSSLFRTNRLIRKMQRLAGSVGVEALPGSLEFKAAD